MRSAASLLDELRSVDESSTIEAKAASKIDRSVMETVCAFANEPGQGGGYRTINSTDTLQASGHLRRLRDLGLLEMKGAGSRTYYVPGATMASDAHQVSPNTHQVRPNTHQVSPNTHQPVEVTIPPDLQLRIDQAGDRPRRETLRTLVRDLCALRPFSARELTALLKRRDVKWLVRDHLAPMIEAVELTYTIPEMPSHPDQKYTVPAEEPNA